MLSVLMRLLQVCVAAVPLVAHAGSTDGPPLSPPPVVSGDEDLAAILERARRRPAPSLPSLGRIRQEARRQQALMPDLGELARRGRQLGEGDPEGGTAEGPAVYVFISFSMPEPTLEALRDQAALIGAPLVLRGMVGDDMQQTLKAMQRLVGTDEREAEVRQLAIDPTLFRRFAIERVPTVVVAERPAERCDGTNCPTPPFHAVGGDVTLRWALERVAGAVPDLAPSLAPKIARLSGGEP